MGPRKTTFLYPFDERQHRRLLICARGAPLANSYLQGGAVGQAKPSVAGLAAMPHAAPVRAVRQVSHPRCHAPGCRPVDQPSSADEVGVGGLHVALASRSQRPHAEATLEVAVEALPLGPTRTAQVRYESAALGHMLHLAVPAVSPLSHNCRACDYGVGIVNSTMRHAEVPKCLG